MLKGNIDDSLEHRLHFGGNILVAGLPRSKAESTALGCTGWAASPADWANTIRFIRAVWVAEGARLNKLRWADEWLGVSDVSVVGALGAGDANVIKR